VVIGKRWAVVAGHEAAAAAGARQFESGGTFVDAAVAASSALAVAMPHATSIGGDAFILVRDAVTSTVHVLNASGVAPMAARASMFTEGVPQRGPKAALVPGLVSAWDALHRRWGRAPWRGLHDAAIALAEDGTAANESLLRAVRLSYEVLRRDPGCAQLLFSGPPLDVGVMLRQPAMGRTLRSIAGEGPRAFYEGSIARVLCDAVRAAGGLLDRADLAAYAPVWDTPVATRYRDHEVLVAPPNSVGVLLLMQLNALERLDTADLVGGREDRIYWQMRAMQAVFTHALGSIADPRHLRMTPQDLLAGDVTADVVAAMRRDAPGPSAQPEGGTACVLTADAAGNACCIVQSVFNPFGAHFLEPITGILLNNRMACFDPDPRHINCIGPGKRSLHTLNPMMVMRDGRLAWVLASPGGMSQTTTAVQMLMNLIDRGMTLRDAVDDLRWATDRRGGLLVEPRMPESVQSALVARGLPVVYADDEYIFGSAKVIGLDGEGTLVASADRRRRAEAAAG
jgi:gamma-glutamyltranspeptidase